MTQIWIGIGSNLQPQTNIRSGVQALQAWLTDCRCSSVYQSQAIGFDGPDFYNLVLTGETSLPLTDTLQTLRQIEYQHGRDAQTQGNGSRWLDLDLLFFGSLCCQQPVILPRPEITENAFVLWPLAELSPDWLHPQRQCTMQQLWAEYPPQRQRLKPIVFDWNPA